MRSSLGRGGGPLPFLATTLLPPSGRRRRFAGLLLGLILAAAALPLEAQDRRPLGHEAYEIWRTIGNRAISVDGTWVHYTLQYEDDDGELVVRHADSDLEHRIARGASPSFTADGARVVFLIRPHVEAVREHRGDRGSGEQPRDSLGILEVESGQVTRIARVQSFRLPDDAPEWLLYHLHPGGDAPEGEEPAGAEPPSPEPEEAPEPEERSSDNGEGALVLRSLETGQETRFAGVASFALSPDAALVAFVQPGPEDDEPAAVRVARPGQEGVTTVMEAAGTFNQLAVDDAGSQLAFLHRPPRDDEDTEDEAEDEPEQEEAALHHWRSGDDVARLVAEAGADGLPSGWLVSPFGSLSFSDSGERLFFGTAPRRTPPPSDPEWSHRLDDQVDVEVWHWQDEELMTVQNVRVNQERRRNFRAVLFVDEDRIVQLEDESLSSVNVGSGGDADVAVGTDTGPYRLMSSWESPNPRDLYLVNVRTGERELIREMSRGSASVSPGERFATWYEPGDSTWYARELATGEVRDISGAIGHPVWDERNDRPMTAGSYGSAGWLEGDRRILLYDRFDLWAVDPTGQAAPEPVTGGYGREQNIRFRLIRLDQDDPALPGDEPFLFSAFHEWDKDAGFYRTALSGGGAPERLVMEPRGFSTPVKADEAERLLFTQETFRDFPDLWVSDADFQGRTRVSHANPQQDEYHWGDTELVEWTSTDGIRLQGVLMTPDGFDPGREYPMVVYFYERWSDGLHDHYAPVPHRSRISFPMYTSQDYVVFIPDIPYRIGYPGEGGLNAVVSGVLHLLDRGFVDRDRIALQGHSWGGYQIAYIVTRSQGLFRAAAAGAPVVNMTSAYGGIRWDSGLVRQFQYERTQSRLGGTLWEMPLRYIENSPLFWVDKIETPLLIMHNDEDGAVPWEQGIEFFVALRRLGKPAWKINYRGEPHWPTSFANRRDWNIRMKQFFDHFLKDEAPPVWMVEGIPAVLRGETLGYETMEGRAPLDLRSTVAGGVR